MNDVTAAHLDRARHALRSARLLLENDEVEDSISRAYYAMLHAARGTLIQVGESPKTHAGVNNRFWIRFVETGRIAKATGRLLSRAQDMREDADYDALTRFDTFAASNLLSDAESFVDEAETLIRQLADEEM